MYTNNMTFHLSSEMTTGEKVQRVVVNILKFVTLLGLLYLFICSLDFLSQAFRLVGGRTASKCSPDAGQGAVQQTGYCRYKIVDMSRVDSAF